MEYQSTAAEELAELTAAARPDAGRPAAAAPVELTRDAGVRGGWWKLRKGLYASVAGARPTGTTALLEDIVVPVAGAGADLPRAGRAVRPLRLRATA